MKPKKAALSVKFSDGTVVSGINNFDAYVNSIKHIGTKRVSEVASDMRFTRKGAPFVSDKTYQSVIDSDNFIYVEVDGHYVIEGVAPEPMICFLNHVSEELGLDLEFHYDGLLPKQSAAIVVRSQEQKRKSYKIVSWNTNGKFREKYEDILKLEADIYVIQECENPATCKDLEYRAFFNNYHWAGVYSYKGLMVFATRPDITLTRLDWGAEDKRVFIPVRINDAFNLVAAWACDPYCEELQDWVEVVSDHLNDETIIIGDLNSNVTLDPKHVRKSGKSFGHVIELLEPKGLLPMWHHHHKQKQGEEKTPTFYLYRHLDKPLHIDHCFASPELVKSILIHARWQWLSLSDHLPLEIETK